MHYLLAVAFIFALVLGPQIWVQHVMAKYNRKPEGNFPGNGSELARHLLDRFNLNRVKVEISGQGDHYDPGTRSVRLTGDKYNGRTLTAITTAAHEVGHAIQHASDDPLLRWRTRLVVVASTSQKLGSFLLFAAPFLTLATRAPSAGAITLLAAFLIMGMNVLVQLATLPVELDASFKKALPLLKAGYLTPEQHRAAERILRAAAFTYLSASLASLLNFWRWLRVLKR
ncbi:MAG: zinc metallopeptidase [Pseudomonadota bacterium]